MAFWRTYYHLVWATKERLPLITPDIEQGLYSYIVGKADALECITHAIGGTEDHLHLVVSIPPKLSAADFVQHIKGSGSHHLNHHVSPASPAFGWQRGYGVFSLGGQQLDDAIAYVVNQTSHHRLATIIAALERCDEEEDAVQRQSSIRSDASK
jgi:putative transposase